MTEMKTLAIRAYAANLAYKQEHPLPKKTVILEAGSLPLGIEGDISKLVEQVLSISD